MEIEELTFSGFAMQQVQCNTFGLILEHKTVNQPQTLIVAQSLIEPLKPPLRQTTVGGSYFILISEASLSSNKFVRTPLSRLF